MEHSFDINIAKEYGIEEAIFIKHFYFWVKKNACNGSNCFDGKYWTFNKMDTFVKLFPYLTLKQVRRVIDNLKEKGLLETGVFNKTKFDRTLWYTLTEKAFALFGETLPAAPKNEDVEMPEQATPNAQMGRREMPEQATPNAQMGRPIPDIYTDNIPSIDTHNNARACEGDVKVKLQPIPFKSPAQIEREKRAVVGSAPPYTQEQRAIAEEYFNQFWKEYPKKQGQVEARLAWMRQNYSIETYIAIIKAVERFKQIRRDWQTEGGRYVPMPENFINNERWKDEVKAETVQFDRPMDIVTMAGMIVNEGRRQQNAEWQGYTGRVDCVEGSRTDTAQSAVGTGRLEAVNADDTIDVAAIWTP